MIDTGAPAVSPWCSRWLPIEAGWIDSYGHMNAGRYFQLFVDEGYTLRRVIEQAATGHALLPLPSGHIRRLQCASAVPTEGSLP